MALFGKKEAKEDISVKNAELIQQNIERCDALLAMRRRKDEIYCKISRVADILKELQPSGKKQAIALDEQLTKILVEIKRLVTYAKDCDDDVIRLLRTAEASGTQRRLLNVHD